MRLNKTLRGGPVGLFLLICHSGLAVQGNAVDAAIAKGLAWVQAHPATCQDGGFLDIVDEGLFYVTIKHLNGNRALAEEVDPAFAACIARLEASPEFAQRLRKPNKTLIEHYHLLLATQLIETVRPPTANRDAIIEAAQRALANSPFANPTLRLTVALLIQHLGAKPRVDMAQLLDISLIDRLTRPDGSDKPARPFGRSALAHPLAYYALVHEVAALTNFGRLPASPWLMERREAIARVLHRGAQNAMALGHVDLLAEMLLCNQMLGLPVTGVLRAGVDYLVAHQQADGSWGEQATPRANRVRHSVQTATAALLASRASAAEN